LYRQTNLCDRSMTTDWTGSYVNHAIGMCDESSQIFQVDSSRNESYSVMGNMGRITLHNR